MARHVFYSFHYTADCYRAGQIRNMGVVDGNMVAYDNEWESVRRKDEASIRQWIGHQLEGKSCALVLIGAETAQRKWVKHEIKEAWNAGKGVLGVHIHRLKN